MKPPKLSPVIAEEMRGTRVCRRAASLVLGILIADLILIVVTGGLSILTPSLKPTPMAFAAREVLVALVLGVRVRILAREDRRLSSGRLMLALAIFPALFHLHFIGRRITGDAVYYYVYTRSMIRDADVDFANEYQHYDLLRRGDFSMPTDTGHRRSIYSVGPGLLWTPFFVAADGLNLVLNGLGFEVNTSGYGPVHINAVALGSFAYGIAALFVIHAFLRRPFGDRLAGGAVLLLWWASFYEWYLAEQPLTSHPLSVVLVAAFFLLRQKEALATSGGSLVMGLVLGVGMSVRWQNGVYLLLPAVDLLAAAARREALGGIVRRGLSMSAGVFVGILPQMLAWKAIYGEYLLSYPPHGADFLRLDRPFLLNTLFSSRHGLLSWTPVFWLCVLGLIPLTRRHPRRFAILWAPLLIMTYVNACSGDWWSGGAYSNRRFDSLLPVFALGLAAFLQSATTFVRRHPTTLLAGLVIGGAVWNLSFVRAVQREEARAGDSLTFAARSLAAARALSHDIGFPTTWPASWIFAARYDASPGAFDLAAGKYLFYRQNNLNGIADIGTDDDSGLILDGFGAIRQDGPIAYRGVESEGRLIVSLDLPETLGVAFAARSPGDRPSKVEVTINGQAAGSFQVETSWGEGGIEVPQALWARGPNIVTLHADRRIDIDRVSFVRPER
ncbi:MAG: hypothetical protein K1Y01_05440 [Vicinamibacteria bacterium]|nr:hypothetical protein [Vicinamibacteria bacterium]